LLFYIAVEYLIISPITGHKELNQVSSPENWLLKASGIDVGHRGAGIARRTDRSVLIDEHVFGDIFLSFLLFDFV